MSEPIFTYREMQIIKGAFREVFHDSRERWFGGDKENIEIHRALGRTANVPFAWADKGTRDAWDQFMAVLGWPDVDDVAAVKMPPLHFAVLGEHATMCGELTSRVTTDVKDDVTCPACRQYL